MAFSDISDEFVGTENTWIIPGKFGEPISIYGTFLGFSSSYSLTHDKRAHPDGSSIPLKYPDGKNMRCSACRWSEFRLFKEKANALSKEDTRWPYFLHFTGMSTVPGEKTRYRIEELLTPREVIEVLITRKAGTTFFSIPAARLLAQASDIDNGPLKEAYNARLVP